MTSIRTQPLVVASMLLALSTAAQAGNARTWISGKGTDQAGCGPISSPCRTIQYAHDNTNAGGEIDVLDSAGYGAVTITKGISIVGDGVIAGLLAGAGANAVTVSAGSSDTVILRGLTIEGAGVGQTGILMTSAGMLDVANCAVQNFGGQGGTGIAILNDGTTNASIQIANTTVSHNVFAGLSYQNFGGSSKVRFVLDHVIASGNGTFGINFTEFPGSGNSVTANISNSLFAFNQWSGLQIGGNVTAIVDLSRSEHNGQDGFNLGAVGNAVTPAGLLVVGRSVSASNGGAGLNNVGGTIQSYGSNQIVANSVATKGTIGTIQAQ